MRTQELEGELRNRHQKIHDFKEQIAMQKGTEMEKKSITKCFNQLANHVDATNQQYVVLDTVTTYVMKYGGAMVGFSVLIPREYLADPSVEPRSVAAVTQGFISNSALLGSLANAMKDLADSFIEVPKVAGLASRVYDLLESFHDVPEMTNKAKTTSEEQVKIVNVTLHAPGENGKLLVKDLNAVIEPRQHTILKGPNGAGKSSIFRTLSGLWEADESDGIFLPEKTFFMPQDCYFPVGNLTAQVTYPMEPSTNGSDAATISSLLTTVGLAELLDYGLDTVKDWNKILSGGQKQRMAWARMFFLKPQFAFIDEGTSAVSHEVIDTLYSTAKNDFNITVVSIAHQESLEAYHGHTIELLADGNGGYVLTSPSAKEKSSDVDATTQM